MYRFHALSFVVCIALVAGCQSQSRSKTQPEKSPAPSKSSPDPIGEASAAPPAAQLDPSRGSEIGLVFEAYLSPHQEPAEEDETPKLTPKQFRSTTPSKDRDAREAAGHRGHGKVRFTKDLSRAFVDVRIEGVAIDTINMFHIHCGMPGILGPILVDFGKAEDIQKNFSDGVFSVEVTNALIVQTASHSHGLVATFTAGCVIPSPSLGSLKPTKASTVAGMARIAQEGELYFNLHTTGQTYFGDIRGQILPAR